MNTAFSVQHDHITLGFDFFENKRLRLRTLLPKGIRPVEKLPATTATAGLEVALQCTGQDRNDHHGLKLTGGTPGTRLELVSQRRTPHSLGRQVLFTHRDPALKLKVESFYVFVDGCPVMRRSVRVTNQGRSAVGIEYLSSAMLHGLGRIGNGPLENQLRIHLARNTSRAEGQWQQYTPSQLGFSENGLSAASINSMGNWSSVAYLPLGMIENVPAGITWFWQIEHNGSWHWELGLALRRTKDGLQVKFPGPYMASIIQCDAKG